MQRRQERPLIIMFGQSSQSLNKPICRFYQKGKCKYGNKCLEFHLDALGANEGPTRGHFQDLKHEQNATQIYQQKQTENKNIRKFKCGNINIDTYMNNEQKLCNIMTARSIDIMGLAVAKHKGCERGRPLQDGFVLIYSGVENDDWRNGVALIVGPRLSPYIQEVHLVNNRLLLCIFKIGKKEYRVYQVFAPQQDDSQEEKDAFMGALENLYQREEKGIIMGNFNARVGSEEAGAVVGPFGEEKRDAEGEKLIEFCFRNNLTIMNGFSKHKKAHEFTWYGSWNQATKNFEERSIIDYFISTDKQMISNVKVYPSVFLDSYHRLIVADILTDKEENKQFNTFSESSNKKKKIRHPYKGCLEDADAELQEIFANKNKKYKIYLEEKTEESRSEYVAARNVASKIKRKARREFRLEKAKMNERRSERY